MQIRHIPGNNSTEHSSRPKSKTAGTPSKTSGRLTLPTKGSSLFSPTLMAVSAAAAGTDRRRRCRCRCHQSSSPATAADTAINVGACAASLHNSIGAIYHETLDFEGAVRHYKASLQWFMPDDEPDDIQDSYDPHDRKHRQQHHHQTDNQGAIDSLHHELETLLRTTRGYRALAQGGGAIIATVGDCR